MLISHIFIVPLQDPAKESDEEEYQDMEVGTQVNSHTDNDNDEHPECDDSSNRSASGSGSGSRVGLLTSIECPSSRRSVSSRNGGGSRGGAGTDEGGGDGRQIKKSRSPGKRRISTSMVLPEGPVRRQRYQPPPTVHSYLNRMNEEVGELTIRIRHQRS